MEISQSALAVVTLYSIAVGFFLGAVYDVFRILRIALEIHTEPSAVENPRNGKKEPREEQKSPDAAKKIKKALLRILRAGNGAIIFIEDIVFFTICAAVITIFIFNINDGQIRWFALAGSGAGFAVYYFTVGKIVMFCAKKIIAFIKAVILFILRITVFPVIKLISALFRLLKKIAAGIYRKIHLAIHKIKTKKIKENALREAENLFGKISA